MTQDWNDTNHDSNVSVGDSDDSFQKHDLSMKAFRLSHAYPIKTATKAGNYLMEHQWPSLIHIWKVPEHKLSHN